MAIAAAPEISGFRALSPLGYGPTSTIYSAQGLALGRWVALTVYSTVLPNERAQRRFARSFDVARRLGAHPHVVTMLESGMTFERQPWVATEIYERGTLQSRVENRQPLPVDEVLHMGILLAGALETAHRADVIHGGIHPARLLITHDGEPALADLGLVPLVDKGGLAALVGPGSFHAPPEVLEAAAVTPATDVYALASTLHTALTLCAPYQRDADDTTAALLVRILQHDVPAIGRRDVPASLEDTLRRALSPEPSSRPGRVLAFARELQSCQQELGLPVSNPVVLDVAASIKLAVADAGEPRLALAPVVESAPPSQVQRVFIPAPEDSPPIPPPPTPGTAAPPPAPGPTSAAPPAASAPPMAAASGAAAPGTGGAAAAPPMAAPGAAALAAAAGAAAPSVAAGAVAPPAAPAPSAAPPTAVPPMAPGPPESAAPAAPLAAAASASWPAPAAARVPPMEPWTLAPPQPMAVPQSSVLPPQPAPATSARTEAPVQLAPAPFPNPAPTAAAVQVEDPPPLHAVRDAEPRHDSPFGSLRTLDLRPDVHDEPASGDTFAPAPPVTAPAPTPGATNPPPTALGPAARALPVIVLVALVVVLGAGLAWAVTTHDPADGDSTARANDDDNVDSTTVDNGSSVPVPVTAVENASGVQLDWAGGAEDEQVVLLLSENEAPKLRPASTGTALLIPTSELTAGDGYCFAVTTADKPTPSPALVASKLPADALVPESCIRGAAPDTVRRN